MSTYICIPGKNTQYSKKRKRPPAHLHVAPAPPYVQRSLRRPLLPLRQASGTVTTSATAAADAAASVAAPGPRVTTATGSRGPVTLELVKLAPPCLRLRVEGPDLLQTDEAPRERLPGQPMIDRIP